MSVPVTKCAVENLRESEGGTEKPAGAGFLGWSVSGQASAFRAAALSVRSQVNSGSSRPKWP